MMSSSGLDSAISGLQANSTWLDVIGNDISNTNTIGFKSGSVSFANQFGQALSSGSADNAPSELGGVNPQSLGTGTRVQSIQTDFSEGTVQSTGVSTDIAIQGNGFLVSKSGSNTFLTRAGNLSFDSNGYLVDGNGGLVQGYNASLQYTKTTINSFSSAGGPFGLPFVPAVITNASYQLNTSDTANITNIQINPNMTMPPKASTTMTFQGNLDAFQQATQPGGVLNLNPNGQPTLPLGADLDRFQPVIPLNPAVATLAGIGGPVSAATSYAIQQTADFTATQSPIVDGGTNLAGIKLAAGNYAWEQQPPLPPAMQTSETVYDSNGVPREVTVQFYQVNDLGLGGINNANGPSQAAYAWYAFDTTGGQPVSTNNLVGGTGILEGDLETLPNTYSYDEGNPGQIEIGDLIYFNTDGSLASAGGGFGIPPGNPFGLPPTGGFPAPPHIYLPPTNALSPFSPIPTTGSEITQITLKFGTFGVIGVGQRDGLTGDAQGTYQTINGVSTYVPDSHATVTQNGYGDGTLQTVSFDQTGTVVGAFSNGQKLDLAQVAMATVENPDGLNNTGTNYFSQSSNSGALQLGLAAQNGFGTIQGSALEGSNVNITVELSSLIVAQRGFDTNARMITVQSDKLQTISQLGQ
ncbi:MAG TPA: flagellar hook-basal body complex protein [bacterium]|jgi:flagellar hook protein FlgE|nr:flagellar hook-basal body complex protein [bacterium]